MSYSECNICYLEKDNNDFYSLSCCTKQTICKTCIELLVQPKCPFCRSPLEMQNNLSRASRSSSISTPDEFFRPIAEPISFLDTHIESFDDTYNYSRIYRRRMRRYTKLRQRELMNLRNMQRDGTFRNRKPSRDLSDTIKDGIKEYRENRKK